VAVARIYSTAPAPTQNDNGLLGRMPFNLAHFVFDKFVPIVIAGHDIRLPADLLARLTHRRVGPDFPTAEFQESSCRVVATAQSRG